jgi:predicted RNA binding protein YcfA (HicA-like mRNA interferase family)
MRIKITYNELTKKLLNIGYTKKRITGSHLVFTNENFNSSIVFPVFKRNKLAEQYFIMTVKKNVIEKGILTEEQFIELMSGKNN